MNVMVVVAYRQLQAAWLEVWGRLACQFKMKWFDESSAQLWLVFKTQCGQFCWDLGWCGWQLLSWVQECAIPSFNAQWTAWPHGLTPTMHWLVVPQPSAPMPAYSWPLPHISVHSTQGWYTQYTLICTCKVLSPPQQGAAPFRCHTVLLPPCSSSCCSSSPAPAVAAAFAADDNKAWRASLDSGYNMYHNGIVRQWAGSPMPNITGDSVRHCSLCYSYSRHSSCSFDYKAGQHRFLLATCYSVVLPEPLPHDW